MCILVEQPQVLLAKVRTSMRSNFLFNNYASFFSTKHPALNKHRKFCVFLHGRNAKLHVLIVEGGRGMQLFLWY